jgi:plastocyanin
MNSRVFAMAAGVGLAVALGWADVSPAHDSGKERIAVVTEQDIEYQPEVLIVHAGESIRVENRDPFEHKTRVRRQNPDGSLGAMAVAGHLDKPGSSFTFTLKEPGAYEVRCLLHDGMSSIIKVVK